ncbi:NEFA-interacting nuclear protein NIP30 [Macrophomina phaseolina MS6]|uniref:NEFA-interacting nuclear protein NIP30 n=1 Tax=Macrophomina phaseolina (strain MS6) TaxID=1126212 RepID=K2S3C5_MACPH|nr:NEFA-interacting nuclear protein NIP30 [Macrophomina phaseolina MS6]
MSSGFVSAGTTDQPIERDADWLKAQQELEAERRRKAEEANPNDGKSLSCLTTAKKQEAFEESIKLKNQFRALDEDEAEFLDSVLESTRAREAALKQETSQQLDAFRRQQDEAERAARLAGNTEGDAPAEDEHWASAGRKRKKGKDRESLMGVKIRRKSSTSEKTISAATTTTKDGTGSPAGADKGRATSGATKSTSEEPTAKAASASPKEEPIAARPATAKDAQAQKPKPTPAALGLGAYSSDEDD